MTPLTTWACDTCGQPIDGPEQGNIIWPTVYGEPAAGFKIVHKGDGGDPRDAPCDTREPSALPLEAAVGHDGLSRLLSWLSWGPVSGRTGGAGVADPGEYVDLVCRLHIPWYEEARSRLVPPGPDHPDDADEPNEYQPYQQAELRRVAEGG